MPGAVPGGSVAASAYETGADGDDGNAIRHTRSGRDGGRFTVHISRDLAGVVVWVDDQGSPGQPCVRDLDELAEGGRGLFTVEALAASWSWRGNEHGRTVRATFSTAHVAQAPSR